MIRVMPTEDLLALCTLAQAPTITAEELRAAVSAAGSLQSATELREPDLIALGWRPSTARLLSHHAPASVEATARADLPALLSSAVSAPYARASSSW
jgi:hypothetical protein